MGKLVLGGKCVGKSGISSGVCVVSVCDCVCVCVCVCLCVCVICGCGFVLCKFDVLWECW